MLSAAEEERGLYKAGYGARELHLVQGNGMEAGAAGGWRGRPSRPTVRLRHAGTLRSRAGAGAHPQAL